MPGEPTAPVNAGAPVNSPTDASPVPANKAPIYRQYWVFGAIYLILPMIIGLIILLTGDIYRMKNSVATPISKKEKMVLTVIAIILQLGAISRR